MVLPLSYTSLTKTETLTQTAHIQPIVHRTDPQRCKVAPGDPREVTSAMADSLQLHRHNTSLMTHLYKQHIRATL